ncbi:Serine/threonine-protein kinase LMTK3 [Nymphon striatum]|nr:Serine/threonine-protein kinase LMTK3 [Nymphon striatum]
MRLTIFAPTEKIGKCPTQYGKEDPRCIKDGNFSNEYIPGNVTVIVLLTVAFLVCLVSILVGCVCCKNPTLKNGLPSTGSRSTSFTNTLSSSEFTMFPPSGPMVSMQPSGAIAGGVKFDPLPDIRLKAHTAESVSQMLRPASFGNVVNRGLNVQDWFEVPHQNFPRSQLQYLQEVGSGWFGHAVEGIGNGIISSQKQSKVVVKILRADASPSDQMFFLQEVKPFRDLSHPHLLTLLGQCLECDPFLLILEHGSMKNLKTFLVENRSKSEDLISRNALLSMTCHISSALHYMHQHGFIHLDLAIRNCLISEELQVKVGDYGIAIEQYKDDYYCLGEVALPLRWCAPESLNCTDTIIETKEITSEANVWTLGVVLWEILEFGKTPYFELNDDDVLQKVVVEGSLFLEQPKTPCIHKDQL